jgi:putative membrane protein
MTSVTTTHDPTALAPSDSTLLALDRTRLAFERTTMAWVRTATSLITFGFSVYKFFQIETHRPDLADRVLGPREFGPAMITIGLIALLLATLRQSQSMQTLRAHYRCVSVPRSLAVVVAALMGLLGVVAFTRRHSPSLSDAPRRTA